MEIELYSSKAENERVNKTGYITKIGNSLEGDLIESTSMYNYVIKLPLTNARLNANYIHIIDRDNSNKIILDKYCYIDDKIWVAGNIYQIVCSVDPLMTYKDDIYKQKSIIFKIDNISDSGESNEEYYNKYYNDGTFIQESRTIDDTELEFSPVFDQKDGVIPDNEFAFLLTCFGGFENT